jgi:hypothetical protein
VDGNGASIEGNSVAPLETAQSAPEAASDGVQQEDIIWDENEPNGLSLNAVELLESSGISLKKLVAEAPVNSSSRVTDVTKDLPVGVEVIRIKAGSLDCAKVFNLIQEQGGFGGVKSEEQPI